jgi:hypothetical protein
MKLKLIVLFFAFLFLLPACFAYITVPSIVTIENALAGGYAEEFVEVYGNYEISSQISLSTSSTFNDWISFEPDSFYIGPDEVVSFKITIQPPSTAAPGVYEGHVIVDAVPTSENEITSAMTVSKDVKMVIKVTDEELQHVYADYVDVSDILKNMPVELEVFLENKGNVEGDISVKATILNSNSVEVLPTTMDIKLPPLSKRTAFVSVPNSLEFGSYLAEISVYSDGCLVMRQLSPFDIVANMPAESSGEETSGMSTSQASPVELKVNGYVFAVWGAVVLFIVFRIAKSRKKKKPGKKKKTRR